MSPDSELRCDRCGLRRRVSFSRCLREGWPMCCGLTMSLVTTRADIGAAVERALGEEKA